MDTVQQSTDITFTSSGEAKGVRDAYDKIQNGGKR